MSDKIFTLQALGTSWWIDIFDELSYERRQIIYHDLTSFIREFENKYSRFKPDSLLSKLNVKHQLISAPIELIEMLKIGTALYNDTKGIFNLMVGQKLINSGYDADYSFVSTESTLEIQNPNDVIKITDNDIYLRSGLIDLGGLGKGYLIDLIVSKLKSQHEIKYFLINGGGDMYGTSEFDKPITIYLEHPTEKNTYLGATTLLDQGFAASSPYKRTWNHAGKNYTHIIDTTKTPIGQQRPDASFVIGNNAVTADTVATVLLLTDLDQAINICNQKKVGFATFTLPKQFQQNHLFHLTTI